jgi:hypothetical protein
MHEDSTNSSELAQVALVTETPIGPATIATRTVRVTSAVRVSIHRSRRTL